LVSSAVVIYTLPLNASYGLVHCSSFRPLLRGSSLDGGLLWHCRVWMASMTKVLCSSS